MIAFLSYPFRFALEALGFSCLSMLYICKILIFMFIDVVARIILGILNFMALKMFRNTVEEVYHDVVLSQ